MSLENTMNKLRKKVGIAVREEWDNAVYIRNNEGLESLANKYQFYSLLFYF